MQQENTMLSEIQATLPTTTPQVGTSPGQKVVIFTIFMKNDIDDDHFDKQLEDKYMF